MVSFMLDLISEVDAKGLLLLCLPLLSQHPMERGINLFRCVAIQVHGWVVVRQLPVVKIENTHICKILLLQKFANATLLQAARRLTF